MSHTILNANMAHLDKDIVKSRSFMFLGVADRLCVTRQ